LEKPVVDDEFLQSHKHKIIYLRREYLKDSEGSYRTVYSLWIAPPDGSDQRFISYCSVGSALLPVLAPTISPDQRKVVFAGLEEDAAARLGLNQQTGLWLFDLEKNQKRLLTSQRVAKILWSDDSRYLYFERGVHGVFKLDAENASMTQILPLGSLEQTQEPSGETFIWGNTVTLHSINGQRLLYTRRSYRMEAKRVEAQGSRTVLRAVGQPDLCHIWLMDLSTNRTRRLCPGEEPLFSPNGRYVVFRRGRELWALDEELKKEKRLGVGNYPAFSPDGRRVAFVDAGAYGNSYGWVNMCVSDFREGTATPVPLAADWQEVMATLVPNFKRSFASIGYFNERPKILWLADGEKVLYTVGYATVFLADLGKNKAEPLFTWLQVSPQLEYIDVNRCSLVLSSPMVKTPRRQTHPLSSSGWLQEEDIWEVSLDGKTRKMLIENGSSPQMVVAP